MRLNFKVIVLAGLAMYVAQFIVGFLTGPLIHDGVLEELYQATPAFWRPELMQDPPDMAALMPRWIATGLIGAFILAGIFDNIRGGLSGSTAVRGVKYGVILFLVNLCVAAGWSGVFNLPDIIWFWWTVESLAYYLVGGFVLGWLTGKLAPEN
jgi:hypothetical protein